MPLKPEYAEAIVVGVMFHLEWRWYVSPPWFWILDLKKYDQAMWFSDELPPEIMGDINYDRSITVVNEETASSFFDLMDEYRVDTEYLRELIKEELPSEDIQTMSQEQLNGIYNNIFPFMPSLMVDFDQQILRTYYVEPQHISFQFHVPNEWHGYYVDILPHVPQKEKYWIIDGFDASSLDPHHSKT